MHPERALIYTLPFFAAVLVVGIIIGAFLHAFYRDYFDEKRYKESVAAGVEPSLAAVSPVLAETDETVDA